VVLLDTHVWIWHVEGDARRIGARTARLLKRWTDEDVLRVSPLSVFEVSSLHTAGRLEFSRTLEQWISSATEIGGVRLLPLAAEAALDAGRIGAATIPDPIDRLLIGTARYTDATLVTADRRILDYAGKADGLAVHDARR
jgi:PIN domain nuclease of toxin-antitoxin system